ncbi:TAXI family TRAP transporter solute-binding subunit [Endozoicomonas sp. SM1973]|uniref:TAXI family TRAP transporter solute-binding subunit n=1 Tax=Spartinivicinus marinus TaxID=2994442 RepID=A0A853I3Q0_9GAMM|nr:TAXI family TRAP transporter solute-binding subunit [Spartinivicinus marinus]MCX4027081.1 TAXI family TRAP transporter solute-binding subunit [Spartinivicinus marinus]NYZ68560.1 TAXI family TRAP transporter solute-binding subunit [Spartinivicinus marinus]
MIKTSKRVYLKRRAFLKRVISSTAVVLLALNGGFAHAEQEQSYILATASTGGTFYPVGVALATLTKVKLQPSYNISLSAISSAGSGENIKLMNDNEAQFAILQGLYGAWAKKGEGQLKNLGSQNKLRSITMLWQNVEHFIIDEKLSKTGSLDDLKQLNGKKFSIGKRNSGTEGSGRYIMSQLGINPNTFTLAYMGYGPSADALQNGSINGMNTPAGVPVSAVTRAFAKSGDDLRILDVTDKQLKKINSQYKLWSRYEIPANTYHGQSKPVKTISQPNFLAVRDDVPEQTVYMLTKTIYENLSFLNGIHKATTVMALNKAIEGLPLPLHPGAAKYFKEKGVSIPSYLQ